MAQLSGTEGSRRPKLSPGQLLAADSSCSGGCRPCRKAPHQVDKLGSCCGTMLQPSGFTSSLLVGFRPRCCARWLAKTLPPLLANRREFAVAGLKVSLRQQSDTACMFHLACTASKENLDRIIASSA